MIYNLLADITVTVHFLWILFLIFGAFLGVRFAIFKWMHLASLVFSILMQIYHWQCPLTNLEFYLRRQADPTHTSPGGFIAHWAEKLVYLQVTWGLLFGITMVVVVLSLWAYFGKSLKKRSKRP